MCVSSATNTKNSHDRLSIGVWVSRADVYTYYSMIWRSLLYFVLVHMGVTCRTAVKNPVGNVNAASQKSTGGRVVSAHTAKC